MKFRPSTPEEPEINLIPLIDVLLLALIFLLVTTSFSNQSQLRLQLPEASGDTKLENATVRVAIDARGQFAINDRPQLTTSIKALREAMLQSAANRKDPVIVIQADRQTPHEAVIRVMSVAQQLGYTHITFAIQQAADGDAP